MTVTVWLFFGMEKNMNPNFWFEYYTQKATKLTSEVSLVVRLAGSHLSKAEIKGRLPQDLRVFLDNDRPLFLNVVLDNLVNRYGLLETALRDGVEVYGPRLAQPI